MPSDLIILIVVAGSISVALLFWIAKSFNRQMAALAADQLRRQQEADITFNVMGNDVAFSSRTAAGRDFMGGDSRTIAKDDAAEFLESAQNQGLKVERLS